MTWSVIVVLRFSTSDSSLENFICFVLFVCYEPKKCRRPPTQFLCATEGCRWCTCSVHKHTTDFAAKIKLNPQHSGVLVKVGWLTLHVILITVWHCSRESHNM